MASTSRATGWGRRSATRAKCRRRHRHRRHRRHRRQVCADRGGHCTCEVHAGGAVAPPYLVVCCALLLARRSRLRDACAEHPASRRYSCTGGRLAGASRRVRARARARAACSHTRGTVGGLSCVCSGQRWAWLGRPEYTSRIHVSMRSNQPVEPTRMLSVYQCASEISRLHFASLVFARERAAAMAAKLLCCLLTGSLHARSWLPFRVRGGVRGITSIYAVHAQVP